MTTTACVGAHTWRFTGAHLDAPALAWWSCTACPAVSAHPPGTLLDYDAWPDVWLPLDATPPAGHGRAGGAAGKRQQ